MPSHFHMPIVREREHSTFLSIRVFNHTPSNVTIAVSCCPLSFTVSQGMDFFFYTSTLLDRETNMVALDHG